MMQNTKSLSVPAANVVSDDFKVLARKSIFYKLLASYKKVTQIGVSTLGEKNLKEVIVDRRDFNKFILPSQTLRPDRVVRAIIEIVCVLIINKK